MKYFLVKAGNGLCGCDDEWITETEKDELNFDSDVLEAYAYESGYCGMENDSDFWGEDLWDDDCDPYYDAIAENSYWEEITEEEFIRLRDEEGWDVR